ncbi:MAG: methylated-DNA--[protein]-cysteine S-methyltransferase [Spirochaetales bacterium]|nr:methylated-DNA--[protein]-cysteine S-methyltransferase [Spirochaetales bacterium]
MKHAETPHQFRLAERCIAYLHGHKQEKVDMKALSRHVGVSEFHLNRLFSRWVGITPDRFMRYLKKEVVLTHLEHTPLLDIALDVGFASPSRVHELLVTYEAMSPGELRLQGRGTSIRYAFVETPFGRGFVAATDRGVLALRFAEESDDDPVADLSGDFPHADIREDGNVGDIIRSLFGSGGDASGRFHLLLRGTNFQVRVWEALLTLPFGAVASYGDVARAIGKPSASRAVGQAVGANKIAYLIPCHRIIRKVGTTGEYQWGIYRKKALLAWEAATVDRPLNR